MNYDVAIIGAGPGGTDAAEHAAAHGLRVVIFEKNKLGGVGSVGEFVGIQGIGGDGYAARIGVFHDHAGRRVKGFDGFPCTL